MAGGRSSWRMEYKLIQKVWLNDADMVLPMTLDSDASTVNYKKSLDVAS